MNSIHWMKLILNGDQSDGKNHWETAGQQFQLAAFAINYLIQVYSSERELTNEKKIELISIAVEMFPQKPNFYVTRGRFYVDDEKYTEALEDLEFAEARLPASIALNESILECHEKLGNEEKVTEYNTKIVELKNEAERDKISTGFSSGQMDVNSEDEEENN